MCVEDTIVLTSRPGPVIYVCMATIPALFIPLSLISSMTMGILLMCMMIAMEAYFVAMPWMIRYSFTDDDIIVHVPFQFEEPPAIYENVWKVVEGRHAAPLHGLSSDTIQIWYDRGTGHYL